jgi:hypothetical protein
MELVTTQNTTNDRAPAVVDQTGDRCIYARLDNAKRVVTREGFYKFYNVPVARSGYFDYGVEEVEHDGALDHGHRRGQILKAYRPKETFTAEVVESINGMPITLNHPKTGLANPDNTKFEGAVTGNAFLESTEDGEINLVISEITLYSRAIISAYQKGMRELSIGFYYKKPVEWVTGKNFNFIEEIIKINHLALVPKGRAGFGYRLNNQIEGKKNMELNLEKISENFLAATTNLDNATLRLNGELTRIDKAREDKERTDKECAEKEKAEKERTDKEAKDKSDKERADKSSKEPEGKGDAKADPEKKGDDGRKNDVFMVPSSFLKAIIKAVPDNVVFGYTVGGKAFDGVSEIDVMQLFKDEASVRKLSAGRMNMFPEKTGTEGRTNSNPQLAKMAAIGD